MEYARISEALRELVFEQRLSIEEAMDKYFADDHSRHNSGTPRTRAEFAEMARGGRAEIDHGTITVLDEFRAGDRYGERHRLDVTKKDGAT